MGILQHCKRYIEKTPYLRSWIIPLYLFFFKYPYLLIKYHTIDPPEYFIFKQKKLVYIVNSKVAQTAITNTCGNSIKREYNGIQETHLGEKKYSLSKNEEHYYSFSFVRNPFDRLYSCYYSKYIADKRKYNKKVLDFDYYLLTYLKKDKGFESFVKKICHIPDAFADRHFKSQYALIYTQISVPPNFIGTFESIESDFTTLQKKFDLDPLPHLNPSDKHDWRNAYTIELVSLVERRFKKDLETWYPKAAKELREYIHSKK
jgi:hypothetical protein